MKETLFYLPERSPALSFAAANLSAAGVKFTDMPSSAVTHVLLPVPTRNLALIDEFPENVTIFGGNTPEGQHRIVDILKDEKYLLENARITAYCAVKVATDHLQAIWADLPVLVIGYGRIGKFLAELLQALGAKVTVASRMSIGSGHFFVTKTSSLDPSAYRVIFNTAPAPVMDSSQTRENTILIDLASQRGISGSNVIWARGLPGRITPESSGALIAKTVLCYLEKEDL